MSKEKPANEVVKEEIQEVIPDGPHIKKNMAELRLMKFQCAAIASCKICEDVSKDLSMRRLGARAFLLFEETCKVELEIIQEESEEIVKKHNGDRALIAEDPVMKELRKKEEELLSKTAYLEYDVIEFPEIRSDGKNLSAGFVPLKTITHGGLSLTLDPYDAWMQLEEEGIFKLIKSNNHGK